MKDKIVQHLKENKMTYFQHFKFAALYGLLCLIAGLYLIIHAIFPCWFQTAGSDLVQSMTIVFKQRRRLDDT